MIKRIFVFITLLFLAAASYAAVPQKMNYQGYLTDSSGAAITGLRTITFRLYTAVSGGSAVWSETQSNISVSEGIFNVMLGSVTSLNNSMTANWRGPLYLELQIQGEASAMSPRHELAASAYALSASRVVYPNTVTVAQDGSGDTTTVYGALQIIAATGTPSSSNPFLIDVQAGNFTETNSITLPDYVSLKGKGRNATTLNFPSLSLSAGSYCTVSDITLNMTGSTGRISLASSVSSNIINCQIMTSQATAYSINLQSTQKCTFTGNYVLAQISGLYTVYIQNAQDLTMSENEIDLTQINTGTGIYAANITRCIIKNNIIRFEGATDSSYGIQINNNVSSSRVSYNIFTGDATTPNSRDIYNSTNGAYPVRPTHTGPYGICNMGSDGSLLPAF